MPLLLEPESLTRLQLETWRYAAPHHTLAPVPLLKYFGTRSLLRGGSHPRPRVLPKGLKSSFPQRDLQAHLIFEMEWKNGNLVSAVWKNTLRHKNL